jgi:cation transport ATPase
MRCRLILPGSPLFSAGVPIVIGALIGLIQRPRCHSRRSGVDSFRSVAWCCKEYAAAGEVAFIMEIGTILEDFTSSKAEKGIESLIRMSPSKARRIVADHEDSVPVEEIRLGRLDQGSSWRRNPD